MESNKLGKLHETLLEILDYVVSVCEENGLQYVLVYGTALGAYRHKGFIPWDDDLDIALPRKDYEKLIEIMKKSEQKKYLIQNESNEKRYYLPFSKVRKAGTLFAESIAQGMYSNNGIFIDIFPLDNVYNVNSINYKLKSYIITYIKHILRYSSYKGAYNNKRGKLGHIAEHIISLPAYIFPKRMLLKWLNKLCKGRCFDNQTKYIAEYSYKRKRMTMPREVYFPAKKITMCGKEYYAPNMIEKYLSNLYGENYMQLPPVEQRRTHLPTELKF